MERTEWETPAQLGLAFCAITLLIHTIINRRLRSDRRRNPSCLPLPPGPKGYPFIGNIFDMPTSRRWRTYAEWAKVYGDIFSFEVLGQRIIILNSLEATQDLFDNRSSNYSDRPRMPMLLELMNFGHVLALLPYGQWWRRHRRTFDEHFRSNVVWKYGPIQARETRAFLHRLLHSPEGFLVHIKEAVASSIMNIVYGLKIQGLDDPYVANIEESVKAINLAANPGSFLVDLIPALKYVPSWFPGAGFKKTAAYWLKLNRKVVELPFDHVAQQMKDGTAGPSVAASLITDLPEGGDEHLLGEEKKIAQNVTAVAYTAGADTTISTIQWFFLAMAKYPVVQKKAQAELDAIIGPHRLPELSDRGSLPYVSAIVKETMRWQLAAPLALPHMATNDDVYAGYFIPKGSIVIGNAWGILHDETVFKDHGEYSPERYLKDGQLDLTVRQPDVGVYGFGRRICPGRFSTDNILFLIISSTLHTFNITPPLDEKGVPIPLISEMTSEVVSYPEPFTVVIKPRSPSAEALVKDIALGEDQFQ